MAEEIKKKSPKLAIGPKLRILLNITFILFAILMINSVYLSSITFAEWLTDKSLQDQTYLFMFLAHLVIGLIIIIPFIIYGLIHLGNTVVSPSVDTPPNIDKK